jgi:hypothetical protein
VDWQGKSRLALIDHGSMAVSGGRAATHWPERGGVLGRVKSWVLAMLAAMRRLCVAAVPPRAADLTRPARAAWMVPGRDGGTGASIELRNIYEQAFGDHPWLFVQ